MAAMTTARAALAGATVGLLAAAAESLLVTRDGHARRLREQQQARPQAVIAASWTAPFSAM